jgi:membrane-bound lytic murein transglycosylase D
MTTISPRFLVRIALVASFLAPTLNVQAQVQGDSSARYVQNEIERNDPRVARIVDQAEKLFTAGSEALAAKNRGEARAQFDKAVDVILDSGIDVRSNPGLQRFYLELVERIYRVEVPNVPQGQMVTASFQPGDEPQIGFGQQEYVPAPTDQLAVVFTPEEQEVTPEELGTLDQSSADVDFKFTPNPLIQQYINFYTGRGRRTMEIGLQRSGAYTKMARRIFREEGVPEDIVWLGQVESAWQVHAVSPAAASGLWQFIPGSGAHWGLRQTAYIDERNSYEQATRASAKYLKFLANRYNGNWELAMGAYNTGEGNIDRAISRAGVSDYWSIYPYILQETRNYVPTILAVMLIAKNPAKYGFDHIRPDSPLVYDVVQVPTSTSLRVLADAANNTVDALKKLNPELRRDVTPREPYNVRIPAGRAQQFVASLKRVPVSERELTQNTAIVRPRAGTDAPVSSAISAAKPNTLKAQKGDTLAKLAARYGYATADLVLLNNVSANAELTAGREIKTPTKKSR